MLNNKNNINLFDEICVSEYVISKLINNYIFPEIHYKNQLEKLNIK
ncbi:MAG: hypothetical protein HPAVJP_5760 [Candidatus Hepatoplasma vulgare]|nr:MAG: hypothetical protein HPAVJP_5760 [Candidatus Hepatoplasma sp.]